MLRLYARHRDVTPGSEHLQPEVDINRYLVTDPEIEAQIKQDLLDSFVNKLFQGKRLIIKGLLV